MIELTLNPDNPRQITKDAFEKLKKSIIEFPQMLEKRPIVYDENKVILGGNMRYRALQDLEKEGFEVKDEYFTDASNWTEEQKREFVIKDNSPKGISGDWDVDVLANKWSDDPLDNWGMEGLEWKTQEVVEDEVPEVSDEPPVSRLGEIYQLGRHRLMCGDSTKIEDVEKLMDGQKVEISFTSPPYNAGKTPTEEKMGLEKKYENYDDDKNHDDYLKLLVDSTLISLGVSEYSFVNLQSIAGNKTVLIDFLYQMKEKYADTLIWDKGQAQPAMAYNVLNSRFEYVHVFSNKATRAVGTRVFRGNISNVIEIGKQNNNEVKNHHATFPVEFAAFFTNNFCEKSVLDLFGGSGSTLIACEQTNRTCYMMELDPHYCDVIRKRYHKFVTGSEEGWQGGTPAIM